MPAFLRSELPVRATARQHWIVLLKRPHRWSAITVGVLAGISLVRPDPFRLLAVLVFALLFWLRVREWRAEQLILTGKRIIHVQGTIETTASEAWLRIDRISGVRFRETVWGKIFNYANIAVEAPGDHPGLSRLIRLRKPSPFYLELRDLILNEHGLVVPGIDGDEAPALPPYPARSAASGIGGPYRAPARRVVVRPSRGGVAPGDDAPSTYRTEPLPYVAPRVWQWGRRR